MPTVRWTANVYMSSDSSFNKLTLLVMIGDQRASHLTHKDCRAICHFSLQFLTFPGTKFIEERERGGRGREKDEETERERKKND